MHLCVHNRKNDENQQAGCHVPRSKHCHGGRNRLCQNTVCLRCHRVCHCRDGEWHGTGDSRMPYHKTRVRRCDQKTIIHVFKLLCDLFCEDCTHDKTKSPVCPASDDCHKRHKENRLERCLRDGSKLHKYLFNDRCARHCGAQHQHQRHLHGKK